MNTSQVINAAREAIIAKGLEVQTSISSDTSLLLGVRSKRHHRVFGPATPLVNTPPAKAGYRYSPTGAKPHQYGQQRSAPATAANSCLLPATPWP
jgi:hypothetical protein